MARREVTVTRALRWLGVLVVLAAAAPAVADEPAAAEAVSKNLVVPESLEASVRQRLEAAIASWTRAEELLRSKGPKAARAGIDEALAALEAVRLDDGKCALPEYYLGIGYQLLGLYYGEDDQLPKAVTRLKAAVRLNPDFHEAFVELGDSHGHLEKWRDAEAAYDAAIGLAPDYALAYQRRAALYLQQQRLREALADVQEALRLEPNDKGVAALERELRTALDGPDWPQTYEVETKNYLIRTNTSQEFAEFIAHRAELIRRLYLSVFPDPPRTKRKFPIIVYSSKQEYHANGGPPSAGGHYQPAFKQLVLFRYPKEEDTLIVLHHEGFHQFFDGILERKAPQWVDEGLGDFFGPSAYVHEGGKEGMRLRTNPWRLKTIQAVIRAGRAVPFERLMNMTQQEMYGQDAGLHYAQAWSMVYFFIQADDRAHFKYLKKYFKALRRGKGRREAYDSAFGRADMAALEARWRDYTLSLTPD